MGEDEREAEADVALLPALRAALAGPQVRPLYQPIVSLTDGRLFAYEALSRGPPGPLESPATLYRIASRGDLLRELDDACCRSALRGARGLPAGIRLFVNLLPTALTAPELRAEIMQGLLAEVEIPASCFVLELTESVPLPERVVLRRSLAAYRAMGASIAIDDYGMGYANLESLVTIRPEFLKLDGSFTQGVEADPLRQEVIRAMATLTRSYGASLIAEGVERPEELEVLRRLEVPYAQGRLLGPPAPAFSQPTRL